jgi:phosphatidate cytidylyltransferase
MKNLIERTFFGALYVAVMVYSIVWAPLYVFEILSVILAALAIREFWILAKPTGTNGIINWCVTALGWIILPFLVMNTMMYHHRIILLAMFVFVWVNDTGAYCVGTLTAKLPGGNHKMAPVISPKKSWEGLFGGIFFTLVAGYIFSIYATDYSWWNWLLIALLVSVCGTLGDLFESKIKRRAGVKDSGVFLPGHGGVLDRFDSVLFAAWAIWIWSLIFN